mmetsp:Transcript_27946/g.82155  ORF Transcript_27946/g.82155 Transcript_27946/m.82155 type:complete len:114 (+) Transcript_27946:186-527(+)
MNTPCSSRLSCNDVCDVCPRPCPSLHTHTALDDAKKTATDGVQKGAEAVSSGFEHLKQKVQGESAPEEKSLKEKAAEVNDQLSAKAVEVKDAVASKVEEVRAKVKGGESDEKK